ncbi:MAG: hypothetical protein NTV88_00925 [Candidatus Micrarchaeota archaeon]|nr:hypothetical protein [Candidatus Micrarchaeota archaeon]
MKKENEIKRALLEGERDALLQEENRLRTMFEDLQKMRVNLEKKKSELELELEENARSIGRVSSRLSHLDLEMLNLMEKRDKVQREIKAKPAGKKR